MKYLFLTFISIFSFSVSADVALSISPPRFEVAGEPGGRIMEIINIQNDGADTLLSFRTTDWKMVEGTPVFQDELAEGSCRPWVSIEKKEALAKAKKRLGYRVQVDIPKDAAQQECRFALMIEGTNPAKAGGGNLSLDIGGRVAIIFYVVVGKANPDLKIESYSTQVVNQIKMPSLKIRNSGNSTGRLVGFLSGTDAAGNDFLFHPSSSPILPGQIVEIGLPPVTSRKELGIVKYPVTVKGTLEMNGQRQSFEKKFE